jgi:hypothetical protein
MLAAITIESTSEMQPMITNWDCHASPNSGSVSPAIAAARKLAPTGPQVQNPKACARPMRGEKSRTSGAVLAIATPSMNDSTTRAASSWPGVRISAIAKQHNAVSIISGISRRTRPTLSVSRPPTIPATAPATAATAEIAP